MIVDFVGKEMKLPTGSTGETIRATAVQFLVEGEEMEEAQLLSCCSVELGELRCMRGLVNEIDVTLRCNRKAYEKLKPASDVFETPTPLMLRMKEAIKAALPSGYGLANFAARAAVGQIKPLEIPAFPNVLQNDVSLTRHELENKIKERPKNVFEKVGRHWQVTFNGGKPFTLVDTLGAKYLNHLLHHPNQPIKPYDLEIAIEPEKAKARSRNSIQEKIDPETVRNYLHKMDELRAERDSLSEAGNEAAAERIDLEIGEIEKALKTKGHAADSGERARGNVSKAIATVRRKLRKGDKQEKDFGDHLDQLVTTGYECLYTQPLGRIWE